MESIKQTAASLNQQRKLVAALGTALERSRSQWNNLCRRLAERESLRNANAELIGRAAEIQAAYQLWRQTVSELEAWDKTASAFREHEKARTPLLAQIATEKARLQEEQRGLALREQEIRYHEATLAGMQAEMDSAHRLFEQLDAKMSQRTQLEEQKTTGRETLARLQAENESLRIDMEGLRERINVLESASGADCPLCGQPLSPAHRKSTLKQLKEEGKDKGDRFRANKVQIDETTAAQKQLDSDLRALATAEAERSTCLQCPCTACGAAAKLAAGHPGLGSQW